MSLENILHRQSDPTLSVNRGIADRHGVDSTNRKIVVPVQHRVARVQVNNVPVPVVRQLQFELSVCIPEIHEHVL